jgi:hypothetical protein
VWGNGATFDNVILRASYERELIPCLWHFWNDRDVRTIVELGRSLGLIRAAISRLKVICITRWLMRASAKYVSAIWQKLIPAQ